MLFHVQTRANRRASIRRERAKTKANSKSDAIGGSKIVGLPRAKVTKRGVALGVALAIGGMSLHRNRIGTETLVGDD